MKKLTLILLFIFNLTCMAQTNVNPMQNQLKQRLILIKQQTHESSVVVGLNVVPDFYEGSIENYCLELANKLTSQQSLIAYRPLNQGKAYSVVSLTGGFISIEPFSDQLGLTEKQALDKFNQF
jgi:hypothetical protein